MAKLILNVAQGIKSSTTPPTNTPKLLKPFTQDNVTIFISQDGRSDMLEPFFEITPSQTKSITYKNPVTNVEFTYNEKLFFPSVITNFIGKITTAQTVFQSILNKLNLYYSQDIPVEQITHVKIKSRTDFGNVLDGKFGVTQSKYQLPYDASAIDAIYQETTTSPMVETTFDISNFITVEGGVTTNFPNNILVNKTLLGPEFVNTDINLFEKNRFKYICEFKFGSLTKNIWADNWATLSTYTKIPIYL